MESDNLLIKQINTLNRSYIKKGTKEFITNNLKKLTVFTTEKENKYINTIIKILSDNTIDVENKKLLLSYRPRVIQIIKKYEEEFNGESNEDVIDEKLSLEQIESKLDNKVTKYNKFNEKHPMEGVSFKNSKEKYHIRYNDIDTYSKDLETACNKIIENFDPKIVQNLLKIWVKRNFCYLNYYFITYWHDNEPYFDIQHIISLLNLKSSYILHKYNQFSDKICYYIWHQNEYGGYILRELISEKTMYKIILNSNSDFSTKFKDEVADILIQIRKEGELEITNSTFKKKPKSKFNNQDQEHVNLLIDPKIFYICGYNNKMDITYVNSLIKMGQQIPLAKYLNKHVLYAFIIPLKTDHCYFIIKFGYTENITDRIETLNTEYKSGVYLIGLRLIRGKSDEQTFHDFIKLKYSYLIEAYEIGNKKKVELYKLSPFMMIDFFAYLQELQCDDYFDDGLEDLSNDEISLIRQVHEQKVISMTNININNNNINPETAYAYLVLQHNAKLEKERMIHKLELKKMELKLEKYKAKVQGNLKIEHKPYNKSIKKSRNNDNIVVL